MQGRGTVARRSRLALGRLFARQRRLRTSRRDRPLDERDHAPHGRDVPRASGRYR